MNALVNELTKAIIEDEQLVRAVDNFLNDTFDELAEIYGSTICEETGPSLLGFNKETGEPIYENEQGIFLNNLEGIKEFKSRIEFFDFIIYVAKEAKLTAERELEQV